MPQIITKCTGNTSKRYSKIVYADGKLDQETNNKMKLIHEAKTPSRVEDVFEIEDEQTMTPQLQSKCDLADYLLAQCEPEDHERWDYICSKILGSDDDLNDIRIIEEYERKHGSNTINNNMYH